jgi:O-antigen/teichoic acid export membrane protein
MLAKAFLPDTEAGYYAGASQVTRMIYFVFMAFSEALFPAVAQAVARNDIELSQRQVRRGLSLLLVLLIPVAGLGMGLTAPTLAVILGPPFAQGADVLLLLIIVAALLTLINVLGSVLSAQGFPAHFLLLVVLALAATFLGGYTVLSAMNTSLEPLVSAQVLAVTVVVILYVTNYLLITLLRRKVPSFGWPFRASIVGFIGFAVLFSLPPFLAPSNWWLLAYGGAWFGAYAAIAYLFAGKYAGIR